MTRVNLNRLANVKNPYQTKAKRVLCVCSAGLLRSPTAANVLHQEFGYNTRAVGISEEYALIPLDSALLAWADEVVFVHPDVHQQYLELIVKDPAPRAVVLNLPDHYEWNDPELRDLIVKQYKDSQIMEKAHHARA